jgi:hypothetical protein
VNAAWIMDILIYLLFLIIHAATSLYYPRIIESSLDTTNMDTSSCVRHSLAEKYGFLGCHNTYFADSLMFLMDIPQPSSGFKS